MSRQNRHSRAAERERFDRIHGEVLKGRTVRELWLAYGRNRLAGEVEDFDTDDAVTETVKHGFYAGAAAMLELMTRVAPDEVSEEQGVEMLTRLQEELHAFADRNN